MLRHLPIAMALGFFAGSIHAGQSETTNHEVEFDGCHFKIEENHGGVLRTSRYEPPKLAFYIAPALSSRHSVEISIEFYCDTRKGIKAFSDLGLENKNKSWALIPNKDDPENLLQAKIYPLAGLKHGLSGAASTANQTTGELKQRTQSLGFCLTDQRQILCGVAPVVGYVAYPRESRLPQVLKLLESIELIEPTQPPAGAL